MKKSRALILIFGAAFALALFGAGRVQAAKDTVRVGMEGDPNTVNPFEYKAGIDEVVFVEVFQQLMKYDPQTGDYIKDIAESIKFLDNGKDILVKMRKGPKFSTGDPVTAKDVRFSWQQTIDDRNACLLKDAYMVIKDIEIVDDYTVIYRMAYPWAAWRELMTMPIASKTYYDKVGWEEFRKHPVGSGAFRIVDRKIGEGVTLEAVPNHPEYNVPFKTLKLVTVPDDMTRVSMLETGELDLIKDILPHQAKRLERNKHVKVKRTDKAPSFYGVAFRVQNDPIMRDKNLAMAFQHAVNRQEIVDKIFLGEGFPYYIFCDRVELGYDPTIKFEFNPEKAREFVKKSGYKPGYPLTLTYTAAVPNAAQVAAAIQKYMKDVGVTIKLQQLEMGTYLTYARNKDKRLGHMDLFTWSGTPDPIWRLVLGVKSDGFYTWYPDRPNKDVIDKLIDASSVEIDVKKREAIIKKIHRLLAKDPGMLPLFGLNMIYAMRDWIDYSWTPKRIVYDYFYNIKVVK